MRKCSTSLAFFEMQIKTSSRFFFTPVGMAIIKKTTANHGEDVRGKEPFYTVGGNVNWSDLYENLVWKFMKKLKIDLHYDPAIPLLSIYPKERKSIYKKGMHAHPYLSTIHNSQAIQ
jgi:hypothetical protein